MSPSPSQNCPCYSGLPYKECCLPFHEGKKSPSTALELMRSRYSGYSLHLPEYIIETTHPQNPGYQERRSIWRKEILDFCRTTDFMGLEIREFEEGDPVAFVTFFARLSQNGHDASFLEKSRFEKVEGRWLYHSGVMNLSE